MFYGFWDLFLHPDAFFARISQENVNLLPPFAIVGAGALFFTIIHVLFWVWDSSGWSFAVLTYGGPAQNIIASFITASVIMPFCIWGLFSVLIFALSRIAGGTGSFLVTIQNLGYGMVPWTISAVLPFLVYLHKFSTYTGGPVIGGYSGIWLMPLGFCALPLLGIMIWSCYLWAVAVVHTDNLPFRISAVITFVPVCGFLLVSVPVVYYLELIWSLIVSI
jgi:hypothetical protein